MHVGVQNGELNVWDSRKKIWKVGCEFNIEINFVLLLSL